VYIDGFDAITALRTVVARAGRDFVYTAKVKCTYVSGGCADCGVAQALAELGVSVEDMAEWDKLSSSSIAEVPMEGLAVSARAVFAAFQRRQDREMSWGDCLDVAEYVFYAMCSRYTVAEMQAEMRK